MTDYWLSKMFFDLQHDPELAKAYRADMMAVIGRASGSALPRLWLN